MSFSPIYIGSSTTPWALLVVTPMEVVLAKSKSTLQLLVIIGILGLIVLGFVLSFIANRLVDNILLFTDFSKSINAGDLSRSITINREDEIGELAEPRRDEEQPKKHGRVYPRG
jgi:methyl-accepting chemotaxis protein